MVYYIARLKTVYSLSKSMKDARASAYDFVKMNRSNSDFQINVFDANPEHLYSGMDVLEHRVGYALMSDGKIYWMNASGKLSRLKSDGSLSKNL